MANKSNKNLFVALAIAALATIILVASFSRNKRDARFDEAHSAMNAANNTANEAAQPGANSGAGIIKNVSPRPELKIHSTGRLPSKLQGFSLGMSFADALNVDSSLACFDTSKGKPTASAPCEVLILRTYDGYFIQLEFVDGRLIEITSDLNDLGPKDADQFDSNTLSQFGQPDAEPYGAPDSKSWIWIDGDIRAHFRDDPWRSLKFELAVYPALLKSLEADKSPSSGMISKAALTQRVREDWGDLKPNVIIRPLPRSYDQMRLGMAPWEIRNIIPGIEISTMSDHLSWGRLSNQSGETDVKFWDGEAYSFGKTWHLQRRDAEELRSNMTDKLGTPTSSWPGIDLVELTWDDGHVKITFTTDSSASKTGDTDVVSALSDDIDSALAESESHKRAYKPAPSVHSFFAVR